MKSILLAAFAAATIGLTGCHMAGGAAKSKHVIKVWDPATGRLVSYECKVDKNILGNGGMFVKTEALQFSHTRTNFLGTATADTLGKLGQEPDADAIKAAGEAAGQVIGAAIKEVVQPAPTP